MSKENNPHRSKKRVAVLLGGWSAEREVSLMSGRDCATALEQAGYEVTRIDVTRDLKALIAALTPPPDAVFNALHGRGGEDGTIQAVLDILGIPYTHSGMRSSAIAMDKPTAIAAFRAAGLPCPKGVVVPEEELGMGDPLPRPYVVKPTHEGSSVGVYIVLPGDNGPDYSNWTFGDALVEEYVAGRELTVTVMGDKALCVTELCPKEGFYNYEAKYTDGKTVHVCPADIPTDIAEQCMDYALRAHKALGCRGVTRSDFRWDDSVHNGSRLFLLEVNTQPGMAPLSLAPEQARHMGLEFPELVSWMVEEAQCD